VKQQKRMSASIGDPTSDKAANFCDYPFRFDVGRDPNKHLVFGFGVHFCLGAALPIERHLAGG
jgi:hypothetical protein